MNFSPDQFYAFLGALMFAGFVGITLVGALIATSSLRLIRSVSGLALCFVGLAGLYYYLNSPFLALMQILIYVGAVCVTIMFAMMLAELDETPLPWRRSLMVAGGSFLVASAFAIPLILLVRKSAWMPVPAVRENAGAIQDLGRELLTRYGFAFELISIVLLMAILGALVVARTGRETPS